MWKIIAGIALLAAAAVGLGLYVFPERPWIGWALLFVCWACYRLKMRADRLFRDRRQAPPPPSADAFPESGSKGGARYGSDTTLGRYYEWLNGGSGGGGAGEAAEPRRQAR